MCLRRLALLLALVSLSPPALAEEVYNPKDPEPTAEETLLLEYVNRLRADPQGEVKRVRENPGNHGQGRFIDWDLFQREMEDVEALPPLVMNLKLLLAARRHAYYLAVNDKRGHVEEDELSGFTGIKMPQRITEAGYTWTSWYENVYVAREPWSVHAGFVIDFDKKTPSGMKDGRGHRVNMLRPELREAGTGSYHRESDYMYVEGFANRKDPARLVGGVIYDDKDGDKFYSVGEGQGGVTITSSDGSTSRSWKSGAWALELKSQDAVTLTFKKGGKTKTVKVAAGRQNVKVDWIL